MSQGETVHLFTEFEVTGEIGALAGWFELWDVQGQLVHGRDTFLSSGPISAPRESPDTVRAHHTILLDVAPGEYVLAFGISSADQDALASYRHGTQDLRSWPEGAFSPRERWGTYRQAPLTWEQFQEKVVEHTRVIGDEKLVVGFDESGRIRHHGLTNLPGESHAWSFGREAASRRRSGASSGASSPVVIHVTHMKAGSQWIYEILRRCAPERIVQPSIWSTHFTQGRHDPGRVYPTVYLTRDEFDRVPLPDDYRIFVVIRDLRDTLVSAYFSYAASHPLMDRTIANIRQLITGMSIENGLLYLLDTDLARTARVQLSWLESGHPLLRYEDLLEHDTEILEHVLLEQCQLGVTRETLRRAVLASRFEQLSGGRSRGQEDRLAHTRKGVAGDWQGHFTDKVKEAFKARYGGILVATGYESNLDW
jgi:lipopolysaccharide transport system ATP-binding protein